MSYAIELKDKDDLIEIIENRVVEMMEKQEDLFSSRAQPGPSCSLSNSGGWKEVTVRYVEHNK